MTVSYVSNGIDGSQCAYQCLTADKKILFRQNGGCALNKQSVNKQSVNYTPCKKAVVNNTPCKKAVYV